MLRTVLVRAVLGGAVIGVVGWGAYAAWQARFAAVSAPPPAPATPGDTASALSQPIRLTAQAQANMGLKSGPLKAGAFRRTIEVPGLLADRPGVSDRGVIVPSAGVVTEIHAYPGDTVPPGAPLLTLRSMSDALHASQVELFKATRETEIAREQLKRLAEAAQSGALAQSRLIEIENRIRVLEVSVQAYRHDLLTRGLTPARIDAVALGDFVTRMTIDAPEASPAADLPEADVPVPVSEPRRATAEALPFLFEVQELKVELGQLVQAGQVACLLADHRALLIEGRGFKDDLPAVQEAARRGLEVEVEFDEAPGGPWDDLPRRLPIRHVANTIDPESRTFGFYLRLDNPRQAYERDGETRLLWRFRPGERVRLRVPVGLLENVFVLPREALVREGPEAYVFRRNGDFFDRKPVHVVHEDRRNVVIANDGSVRPGFSVALNGAAVLDRALKAQAASGMPANVHVHADGTVHAAH